MAIYAHILDGRVVEIITAWKDSTGRDVPIEERYAAGFVANCVDITKVKPVPLEGDCYDGTNFSKPVALGESADVLRADRLRVAAAAMAPLQDAVDLGINTAAEASALTAWKQYRVALNRLDLSSIPIQWPVMPDA